MILSWLHKHILCKGWALPEAIIQVMQVINAHALVDSPHAFRGHVGYTYRHGMLLILSIYSHRPAGIHLQSIALLIEHHRPDLTQAWILLNNARCWVQSIPAAAHHPLRGMQFIFVMPYFVVDGGASRGEARAHDIGASQHKLDRAFVNSEFGHHIRILMKQPQSWEPGSIPLSKK